MREIKNKGKNDEAPIKIMTYGEHYLHESSKFYYKMKDDIYFQLGKIIIELCA